MTNMAEARTALHDVLVQATDQVAAVAYLNRSGRILSEEDLRAGAGPPPIDGFSGSGTMEEMKRARAEWKASPAGQAWTARVQEWADNRPHKVLVTMQDGRQLAVQAEPYEGPQEPLSTFHVGDSDLFLLGMAAALAARWQMKRKGGQMPFENFAHNDPEALAAVLIGLRAGAAVPLDDVPDLHIQVTGEGPVLDAVVDLAQRIEDQERRRG